MSLTTIFYVTDLHGSDTCFRKFLNAAKVYRASYLVCGGDISGKMIVPIVAEGTSRWRCSYLSSELRISSEDELQSTMKTIKGSGFYPVVMQEEQYRSATESQVEEMILDLMRERLLEWGALAEERLTPAGVKGFIMPGNDDPEALDAILDCIPSLVNTDGRVVRVGDFEMASIGHSNITPWHCPRDVSEEELARRIDAVVSQVKDVERCIFNFHCPPYDSQLDLAPELDDQLRPKLLTGGEMKMVPVGSTAVREAIEKYQPMLALHGHIHESRGAVRIGRTLCINPGSEYQTGTLHGILLAIKPEGRIDWALTTG